MSWNENVKTSRLCFMRPCRAVIRQLCSKAEFPHRRHCFREFSFAVAWNPEEEVTPKSVTVAGVTVGASWLEPHCLFTADRSGSGQRAHAKLQILAKIHRPLPPFVDAPHRAVDAKVT